MIEKFVYNQLLNFAENNNLLSIKQYGSRLSKLTTTSTIADLIFQVINCFKNGHFFGTYNLLRIVEAADELMSSYLNNITVICL